MVAFFCLCYAPPPIPTGCHITDAGVNLRHGGATHLAYTTADAARHVRTDARPFLTHVCAPRMSPRVIIDL